PPPPLLAYPTNMKKQNIKSFLTTHEGSSLFSNACASPFLFLLSSALLAHSTLVDPGFSWVVRVLNSPAGRTIDLVALKFKKKTTNKDVLSNDFHFPLPLFTDRFSRFLLPQQEKIP